MTREYIVHIDVDAQIVVHNREIPCIINVDVRYVWEETSYCYITMRSNPGGGPSTIQTIQMQELKCKVNTKINYEIVFWWHYK